ncbi:hypothetical protein BLOT_002011 [Blomia tropicalis]|nr:hypothetical protein BLOT_002011 [Blomia tropicalis]
MKSITLIFVVIAIFGCSYQPQSTNMVAANPFQSMFRKCCYYVAIRNCTGNGELSHLCPDCSKPTPFCGEGRCNVFGCNCDGCRPQQNFTEIIGTATWFNENL